MATSCPQCSAPLPEGARFCPRCGATVTGTMTEERKLVTVLFADITGSTQLGERFDPERWRTLLRRFFSVMAASIEGWGGTVQKFAGDAVMATFGVPIVREDDAERALRAACEMLDRLTELNREFEAQHGVTLAIRVGVNTGEAVAAPDELVVTGDAVNVAARLEQLADPGTILAGERTFEAARDAFAFGPPEIKEVRGKSAPLSVRLVLHPVADRPERRLGLQVPMVGRDADVETLARLFHEAMDTASPRMALVLGPAGIGKSRLVREFLNLTAARHPERVLLQGRCPSAGKGLTYWALGELLRRECGISLDESGVDAAERLHRRAQEMLAGSGLPSADVQRTIDALAMTAGIQLKDNPLEQVRPVAVDLELAMAWPRFISAYTTKAPVILMIEDLHWADERLIGMLDRLLARSTGPLLMLATARPDFRETNPNFGTGREEVDFLVLHRLSQPQSEHLLDELLRGTSIDASLRTELLSTADGNPFFLEEIIRRLSESGALQRDTGSGRLTATPSRISLPDTVHAVLSARIDALPAQEKRALQEAAVIGRVFWTEPLQRATGDANVTDTMLALESKGLVVIRGTSTVAGDLELSFKHALVRDVAYASLPLARRARAHADTAAWLEELAGDRREGLSGLIAHHYRNAIGGEGADLAWGNDPIRRAALEGKALEAFLTAGIRARQRFAVAPALELHQEALQLARTKVDRARVLEAIGDDHEGVFHGDDAVAAWDQAIALIENDPNLSAQRVRLLMKSAKMSAIRWGGFKVLPPTRQVDGYVDAALKAGPDERERGWLLAIRAYLDTRKGDPAEIEAIPVSERMRAGEEAAEIGGRLADTDMRVLALRALSGLAITNGDYGTAMAVARQESLLFEDIAASRDRALSIVFYALRLMDIEGGYEQGLAAAAQTYRLGKELTIHEVQHATFLLLYGNAILGRWDAIDAPLDEHLDDWRHEHDITCPYARAGPLVGAWALAQQGKVARAKDLLGMVPMDWKSPALPEAWYGLVLLKTGEAPEARSVAERILSVNRRITYEEAPLEYILMLGALIALEDWDALAGFLPSAERMRAGLALLGPVCDRAAALLAFRRGDVESGRKRLEAAIAGFEQLKASPEVASTRALLAQTAKPV